MFLSLLRTASAKLRPLLEMSIILPKYPGCQQKVILHHSKNSNHTKFPKKYKATEPPNTCLLLENSKGLPGFPPPSPGSKSSRQSLMGFQPQPMALSSTMKAMNMDCPDSLTLFLVDSERNVVQND